MSGALRCGRLTPEPGPLKCHHSLEYTVMPPEFIADRSRVRFDWASELTP